MLCRCIAILSVTQGVSQVGQHAIVYSCLQLSLLQLHLLQLLPENRFWPPHRPADLHAEPQLVHGVQQQLSVPMGVRPQLLC